MSCNKCENNTRNTVVLRLSAVDRITGKLCGGGESFLQEKQ